ncbi:MAG: hypothetical protein ACI9AR_000232 [Flavobacteriaceae bacterium]|jgi:hypothetical protein
MKKLSHIIITFFAIFTLFVPQAFALPSITEDENRRIVEENSVTLSGTHKIFNTTSTDTEIELFIDYSLEEDFPIGETKNVIFFKGLLTPGPTAWTAELKGLPSGRTHYMRTGFISGISGWNTQILDPNAGSFKTEGSIVITSIDNTFSSDCPTGYYCSLAPLPGVGDEEGKIQITGGSFGSYLNSIFRFGIGIVGVLAVIMIVIAGFKYLTTEAFTGKGDAKQQITMAIGGLVLALGSFLILNTINSSILTGDLDISTVKLQALGDGPPPEAIGAKFGAKICTTNNHTIEGKEITQGMEWGKNIDTQRGDDLLRNALKSANITFNKNNCELAGDKDCTSMYYNENTVRDTVQKRFENLVDNCSTALGKQGGQKCTFEITGGSECWAHQTHGPASYSFDISKHTNADDINKYFNSLMNNDTKYDNPVFKERTNAVEINKFGIQSIHPESGKDPHWHIVLQKP